MPEIGSSFRIANANPPLASLDPPKGRVTSLSLWESLPERQERGELGELVEVRKRERT